MNINVVDCKKKEIINIKIELSENMFIVVPEVLDPKFNYLKYRLLNLRKEYMNKYLADKNNYKLLEQTIYNEMKELLMSEMKTIYKTEGLMYYTR